MRRPRVAGPAVALAAVLSTVAPVYADRAEPTTVGAGELAPLAGRVVLLDPGHQLGNGRFADRIGRLVPDGRGGRKPCNTVGTATDGGYPEATLNWQVAGLVRSRLERLGATVRLTRTSNSASRWGPCVDARGRAAGRVGAHLAVSIHADGNLTPGARGFHVIVAPDGAPGTRRLADRLRSALRRAGVPAADYVGAGNGLDVRTDLATLNGARVPAAMVELGNMRDPVDAARMTDRHGRATYAAALVRAIRGSLR